jgi:hypothetical protein
LKLMIPSCVNVNAPGTPLEKSEMPVEFPVPVAALKWPRRDEQSIAYATLANAAHDRIKRADRPLSDLSSPRRAD